MVLPMMRKAIRVVVAGMVMAITMVVITIGQRLLIMMMVIV